MRLYRPVVNYVTHPNPRSPGSRGRALLTSLLSTAIVFLLFFLTMAAAPLVAFADDDEDGFDSGPLESAFADASPDQMSSYLSNIKSGNVSVNTFQYVIGRLIMPQYINYLPQATVAANAKDYANLTNFHPSAGAGRVPTNYICQTNQIGAGSPIYHNCDIPNFSAEFLQNLYALFDRSGPQNAYAVNAGSVLLPKFGQPKSIPGDSVPGNPAGAPYKYTGLEVFGYDLQLSSYYGEWDHIQTIVQARLLTNFGFFDSINLTGNALANAIGGAFDVAGAMGAEGWNRGGIFGAISGFFNGLFQGGSSAALNTMLDTSDANIALTQGWFRVNYANTSYGLRSLTNQEIAAQIRAAFLSYLNATMPENMSYDEWFNKTNPRDSRSPLALPPKPPIASCTVYSTPGGGAVVHGSTDDTPPGITSAECKNLKQAADRKYFVDRYRGLWSNGITVNSGSIVLYESSYYRASSRIEESTEAPSVDSRFTNVSGRIRGTGNARVYDLGAPSLDDGGWDRDGIAPAESFNKYLVRVKDEIGNWDSGIAEYGISLDASACQPTANWGQESETVAAVAYTSWLVNCWIPQWEEKSLEDHKENQGETNETWLTSLLEGGTLALWAAQNGNALFDFNSPWKRLVCLNPDGSDVVSGYWNSALSGGDTGMPILTPAFLSNGSVNPDCPQSQFRAPVQDGLFGNGYEAGRSNQNPSTDTRHISNYFGSEIVALQPFVLGPLHSFTQSLFSIGQFVTQLSNEIITFTYSPILESLGITNLVTELIESLRDSIFFPLALLVIAAAGLYIIYQAGIKRKYREMFVSSLYLVLIFILGAVLMNRPMDVVNFVDKAPAAVEKALLSMILSQASGDDKLCTTDSTHLAETPEASWDDLDLLGSGSGSTLDDYYNGNYSSADDPIREVLCANWRAFVYYPWAFAQWGTSPDNLEASLMENTNSQLVGNAAVDLGGSNGLMNNWAVYQLDTMKVGTSTTVNWSITGVTLKNKDFYKIVDMQAGPNNGAGTDARYLNQWAGMKPLDRLGVGFMSTTVAVVGAVTVAAYSITKIVITFISVMMLIFLPFVFLFGLFPPKRNVVKSYFLTILSLSLQRIALMLMIGIFLLLLISILGGATDYSSVFLIALIFCVIFLKLRKPILKFAMDGAGAAGSGINNFAERASNWGTGMAGVDGVRSMGSTWGQTAGTFAPQSLRNLGSRGAEAGRNAAAGAIAGTLLGQGALTGARNWATRNDDLQRNRTRRTGFGGLESITYHQERFEREALAAAARDESVHQAFQELQSQGNEAFRQYIEDTKAAEQWVEDLKNGDVTPITLLDEYGEPELNEHGEWQVLYAQYREVGRDEFDQPVIDTIFVSPPPAPVMPEIFEAGADTDLTVKEVGFVRHYAGLSKEYEDLGKKRTEARQSLYSSTESSSILLELDGSHSEEEISAAIAAHFPDHGGWTSASRDKMSALAREIKKLDGEMDSLDKKMKKEEKKFADTILKKRMKLSEKETVKRLKENRRALDEK